MSEDKDSQKRTEDREVLDLQKQAMFLTLDQFERNIATTEHFAQETAIKIGLIYISRVLQESVISLKMAKDSQDHDKEDKLNKEIEKLNTILQQARKGSFIPLKGHLQEVGDWLLELAETLKGVDKEESEQQEKIGRAFSKMTKVIPDTGNSYSL